MENECGIIILAAGISSRLGKSKQTLIYRQNTLLEHSIITALGSIANQVVVVLGAHAATLQPAIKDQKLTVIINEQWQQGMAASIRCGLHYLLNKSPGMQTAVFMVCDQPFVSIDLLDKLITLQKQTGHTIVASEYAGIMGIPAAFDKKIFPDLLKLEGDTGAKKLIAQYDTIAAVPFPLGNIDIDTAADYEMLKKM